MEKRHISGHEVVHDINSGMDDLALMDKYRLSPRELDLLMKKLVEKERISEADLSELQLLWAQKRELSGIAPRVTCHKPINSTSAPSAE